MFSKSRKADLNGDKRGAEGHPQKAGMPERLHLAHELGLNGSTEHKQPEEALPMLHEILEQEVAERTAAAEQRAQELVRSEAALRESQAELSAILDSTPILMVLVDRERRVRRVNPAVVEFTGRPAEEIIGLCDGEALRCLHSLDDPKGCGFGPFCAICPVRCTVMDTFETGKSHRQVEVRLPFARGETQAEMDLLVSTTLLSVLGEQMVLVCFEDITDRKQAEEALQKSNRKLEEALAELRQTQQQIIQQERLHALAQMASGIAHDFNNALVPIMGYIDLLLMRPDGLENKEKVIHYLELIKTSARDAASVVSRLREFYRPLNKNEVFNPVNLNRVVNQAITLTEPKWKTQAQARDITINIVTNLQEIPLLEGNEAELREILTNLIFNAVDAMPEGGTINLCTSSDGEYIVLTVSDTGVGMIEEVRQHCLEPFFTTKKKQGTGLGLAMVYGMVQRYDGTISIASEPGKGTSVRIRLPAARSSWKKEDKPTKTAAFSQPLHALIVDDDPQVREILTAYLTRDGHTVVTAVHGRDGLEKFKAGWFDLVVTDQAMPEMNGDHLARAIKQIAPHKPIIMLTGFGDMIRATDEKPGGVDLIVSKPVAITELQEALAQIFG